MENWFKKISFDDNEYEQLYLTFNTDEAAELVRERIVSENDIVECNTTVSPLEDGGVTHTLYLVRRLHGEKQGY